MYLRGCLIQTFCCCKKQLELIQESTSWGEQWSNHTSFEFKAASFDACQRGFSNASVQQNPLGGLLKQIAGPSSPELVGLGWSCRICLSNGSQVMLQVPKCGHTLRTTVGEGEGGMFRENSMYIIYSETDHEPRLDA